MTDRPARQPGVFDRTFLFGVKDVTEVLLVRHAQQEFNYEGPISEAVDPPLSEQGRQQARLVGEALSTLRIDAVFSSPLKRAFETAQAIAQHQRQEPRVLEDLREVEIFRDVPQDRTALESMGKELLKAARERMLVERSWDVYPYSESSFEFRKRTINAIETAIAFESGERIAVVCHGGVINAYVSHVVKSSYDMMFRPAHTSVSVVLAGEGRRVLTSLNDVHHLRTAEGDFHSY
jgi:broad specificity phosphatase PhoE